MSAPVTRFTVKRSEWRRGEGTGSLLREGRRCCLGFLGIACGLTDADMSESGMFSGANLPMVDVARQIPASLFNRESMTSTAEAWAIAGTNDNGAITDAEREARLTEQFAAIGIAVEFVP